MMISGVRKAAFILSGIIAAGLAIALGVVMAANYGVDISLPDFKL
jgi:hypothetical protein